MTGGSNVSQACAACKHQRRKCAPDCVLAPFFPPHRQAEFLNVHRLFGVRNIMNTVKKVEMSRRGDAVRSMVHEAYFRAVDPVGGAYRILNYLGHRYTQTKAELDLVQQHLAIFRSIQIDGMDSEHMQHPPNYSNFIAQDFGDISQQQFTQAGDQTSNIASPRNNMFPSDIIKKEGSTNRDNKKAIWLEKKGSSSYDSNSNTKMDKTHVHRDENETNRPEDVKLNVGD